MISFLPVASAWPGQWGEGGASVWSGLDIIGHVLGKVRKVCVGEGGLKQKRSFCIKAHPYISLG